ncbi:MAG: hypothetical protein J2P58_00790 [Acidimicrobiaceae bacterium]|nr:hypothetical protein [Acidimicrobiaceae bacterium]
MPDDHGDEEWAGKRGLTALTVTTFADVECSALAACDDASCGPRPEPD